MYKRYFGGLLPIMWLIIALIISHIFKSNFAAIFIIFVYMMLIFNFIIWVDYIIKNKKFTVKNNKEFEKVDESINDIAYSSLEGNIYHK